MVCCLTHFCTDGKFGNPVNLDQSFTRIPAVGEFIDGHDDELSSLVGEEVFIRGAMFVVVAVDRKPAESDSQYAAELWCAFVRMSDNVHEIARRAGSAVQDGDDFGLPHFRTGGVRSIMVRCFAHFYTAGKFDSQVNLDKSFPRIPAVGEFIDGHDDELSSLVGEELFIRGAMFVVFAVDREPASSGSQIDELISKLGGGYAAELWCAFVGMSEHIHELARRAGSAVQDGAGFGLPHFYPGGVWPPECQPAEKRA